METIRKMLPHALLVFLIIFPIMILFDHSLVIEYIGDDTGPLGILLIGIIGSIAYIPAMVAFPLSVQLLNMGAGYGQVTMFVTTLSIVNIATLSMEIKFLGKEIAFKRNTYSFIHAFIISVMIDVLY